MRKPRLDKTNKRNPRIRHRGTRATVNLEELERKKARKHRKETAKRPRAQYEIMRNTSGQEGAEGHAPNLAEIRVFSVGKSLKIEPCKIPENPLEIGRAWKEWIEDFEDETSSLSRL